jgi:hypothetical protein
MSEETTFYTETQECDGCGASIVITDHEKGGTRKTDAAAEALGWTTVDKGKKVEIFCPWCVERAQRIVRTVGTGRAS